MSDPLLEEITNILLDPDPKSRLLRIQAVQNQFTAVLAKASFAQFVQEAWPTLEPGTTLEWNWHHQLMCDTLQAMFHAWQDSKTQRGREAKVRSFDDYVRNVVFNVPPGSLKPVDKCLKVLEKTQGYIPLSEIKEGDSVLTHQGRFKKVLAVSEQPQLETLLIITGQGREIRAEKTHPFLTQRGWVEAGELKLNDTLCEIHTQESSGTATIPLEEARLLGYLIGDGCLAKHTTAASFTNQDPETIADFAYCGTSIGLVVNQRARSPSQRKKDWSTHVMNLSSPRVKVCLSCGEPSVVGVWCRACYNERERLNRAEGSRPEYNRPSQALGRWLDKHDIRGKDSRTKRVPELVMRGSHEIVKEYLAAYWACDGGIQDRRDLPRTGRVNQLTNTVRIDCCTISEGLARDHQLLLSKLGLKFKLRKKIAILTKAMTNDPDRVGDPYVSWMLVASDQDTCAKFMQIIGPRIRHEKRTRAKGLVRTGFDSIANPDPVVSISPGGVVDCRCLKVEDDESFVVESIAVHNSRIIGVSYQPWCWLHEPSTKFICLSVNEDATLRDGRMSRDLIKSEWYQRTFRPRWTLKTDQDAISNYGNSVGGERLSKPSGSEVVGLRGDILILDDPNNPKEAENKVERNKINELYNTNIANRVNDPRRSLRIGVQQRVNVDDWSGWVIKNQGLWAPDKPFGWLHVVLPAEYDPKRKYVMPECLRKYVKWPNAVVEDPRNVQGESLHRERFTKDYLEAEKSRWKHTTNYSGQMQQQPAAAEGQLVQTKWWGWFRFAKGVREDLETGDHPRPLMAHEGPATVVNQKLYAPGQPDFDWVTISVDPAAKKTEKGSQYGLLAIAGKGGRRFVLDDRTQRGAFHEIIDVLKDMIRVWKPDTILIEPNAAGPDLMDTLREEMFDGTIPMVSIEEADPGNQDKEMRLQSCLSTVKNGAVYLLEGASWVHDFIEEMGMFPAGSNDDRVDAFSQCLNNKRANDDGLPSW
jgi:predicted phage terminase large subunit-like protein